MQISTWFWMIWVIAFVFGGVGFFRAPAEGRWVSGGSLLFYVLTGLLGWAVFGSPVKG